jgi:hypothetical protein
MLAKHDISRSAELVDLSNSHAVSYNIFFSTAVSFG